MHEITIISGKGGTGKTSLTAAFAHLASNHVVCDLDVDAADLHILLRPRHETEEEFRAGHHAVVIPGECTDCGLCRELCRFGAVTRSGEGSVIDPLACEGCKVCVQFCPENAIAFPQNLSGRWYRSTTRFAPMVHAQLLPGEENSGLLVSVLRSQARVLAEEMGRDLILCDGAPGIGCPVISSLTGTDLAVAVTEPTPSGRHDLERVADLCAHFQVALTVIINKCDLNEGNTRDIKTFCSARGLTIAAQIPFDPIFTDAQLRGQVVTEYQSAGIAEMIERAWADIQVIGNLRKAA
ncbi:MAG: 4Fe-4S binding protein [Rhodospirillales bacterium]|jgi:MinD superfamily P-loop ATPase|nr:4Fe-4S binding protein [Rhodospirillales bacterium]